MQSGHFVAVEIPHLLEPAPHAAGGVCLQVFQSPPLPGDHGSPAGSVDHPFGGDGAVPAGGADGEAVPAQPFQLQIAHHAWPDHFTAVCGGEAEHMGVELRPVQLIGGQPHLQFRPQFGAPSRAGIFRPVEPEPQAILGDLFPREPRPQPEHPDQKGTAYLRGALAHLERKGLAAFHDQDPGLGQFPLQENPHARPREGSANNDDIVVSFHHRVTWPGMGLDSNCVL